MTQPLPIDNRKILDVELVVRITKEMLQRFCKSFQIILTQRHTILVV